MKQFFKKPISVVLALLIVLGSISAVVFAEDKVEFNVSLSSVFSRNVVDDVWEPTSTVKSGEKVKVDVYMTSNQLVGAMRLFFRFNNKFLSLDEEEHDIYSYEDGDRQIIKTERSLGLSMQFCDGATQINTLKSTYPSEFDDSTFEGWSVIDIDNANKYTVNEYNNTKLFTVCFVVNDDLDLADEGVFGLFPNTMKNEKSGEAKPCDITAILDSKYKGLNNSKLTTQIAADKVKLVDVSVKTSNVDKIDGGIVQPEDAVVKAASNIILNAKDGTVDGQPTKNIPGMIGSKTTAANLNAIKAECKGKEFLGWSTNQSGTEKDIITGEIEYGYGDTELFAVYKLPNYTLTYKFASSTDDIIKNNIDVPAPETYQSGYVFNDFPSITIPDSEDYEEYTFDGWYTSDNCTDKVNFPYTLEDNVTVYGLFKQEIVKYKVIYTGEDGKTAIDNGTFEGPKGEEYEVPAVPAKEGYDGKWSNGATPGSKAKIVRSTAADKTTVVTPVYTAKKYTVTFNANGGSCSTPNKQVEYDNAYGDLPKATKAGYGFDGWFTAAEGGNEVKSTDTYKILGDQTLYAHFTEGAVTVNFIGNGGQASDTQKSVTFNKAYGDLPTATRTGYTFAGWFTAAEGGTEVKADTVVTNTETHNLYAHWTANKVEVELNADGIEGYPKTVDVFYDGTYSNLPTDLSKPGYNFDGWYTQPNGAGTKVTTSTKVTTTAESEKLYANFTEKDIVVTFEVNGGASVSPATKTVKYGKAYGELATAVAKEGFGFKGWFTEAEGGTEVKADTIVANSDNHKLYAHYAAGEYTVTFDACGGTATQSNKVVKYNETYGDLPTASKDGYDFNGWYTAAQGGTKVEKTTTVTKAADHKLYAQYTAKQYDITFDATTNGGTTTATTRKVTFGSAVGTLPTASKTGFEFKGWFTEANGGEQIKADTIWDKTENKTLYAQFDVIKYTVQFVADGQVIDSKTDEYGKTYTAPTSPEATGYTNKGGWSKEGSEEIQIADGASYTITENATYYPCRTANTYTFTFKYKDGTIIKEAQGIYGTEFDKLVPKSNEITVPEGYVFAGWDTNGDGIADTLPETVPAGDLTIYPVFELTKDYVVNVYKYGNEFDYSIPATAGEKFPSVKNARKFAKTFKGWDMDGDGIVDALPELMPYNDVNLYPVFDEGGTGYYPVIIGGVVVASTAAAAAGVSAINAGIITGAALAGTAVVLTGVAHLVKNSYTVTYKVDGEVYRTYQVIKGTKVIVPSDPTKAGKSFKGWNEEIPEKMPAHDLVFEARFTGDVAGDNSAIPATGSGSAGITAIVTLVSACAAAFVLKTRKKDED